LKKKNQQLTVNEPMIDEISPKLAPELKVPNGYKTEEPKTSIL
jgi:hypothetical protein